MSRTPGFESLDKVKKTFTYFDFFTRKIKVCILFLTGGLQSHETPPIKQIRKA